MVFEIKSSTEIGKLKRDEAISYALQLTSAFSDMHTNIVTRLESLESLLTKSNLENARLTSEVKRQNDRILQLERQANNDGQYLRKRQIELWNLPDETINAHDLKAQAATLLSLTGVPVAENDIDVAHRMKKSGQIIVELKSATHQFDILKNRKELKHKKTELSNNHCPKLSIVESMSYEYKRLDYICRKLVKDSKLEKSFFFNRKLHVVHEGAHKLIGHTVDLVGLFSEEVINGIIA